MKPRRASIGTYSITVAGKTILIRRMGRSGFRIEHRPGAISKVVRRLRDAVTLAVESASPWPFTVDKKPDLAFDLPPFLDRRNSAKEIAHAD